MLHYNKWILAYEDYLKYMYINIMLKYTTIDKLSFNKFCEFMYLHSSGYITQYA